MTLELFLQQAKQLGLNLIPTRGAQFFLENYFFSAYEKTVELHLQDEDFNIRHPKGYWVVIKEPAEIITLNYYEYYLPQIEQGQTVSLPLFWEEKYQICGVGTQKISFRTARRRTLLKKLEEHFGKETGLKDQVFWQELTTEFSDCVYTGPAYRAILVSPKNFNSGLLATPGYSWALSMEGVRQFIFSGDTYPLSENPEFVLVEGIIRGISLIHIKQLHPEDFKTIPESSEFKEEEVVLLELIAVTKVSNITAEDIRK